MACFKTALLEQHVGGFTRGKFEDTLEIESGIVFDSSLIKQCLKIKSISNIPFNELPSDITERLLCPICDDTLINTNIFWELSRNKKKFVSHMKTHIEVTCSLCSSVIKLNPRVLGTHMKACRISSGVASLCPICNLTLPKSLNGHLRRHIPPFSCPYPQCSILITFGAIKIHMQYHFDKLIESFLLSHPRIRNVPGPLLSTDAKAVVHSSIIPLSCVVYKAMHLSNIDSPISDFLCPFCHIKHLDNSFYCPICKDHHALVCLNKAIETIIEHLETHVSILCPVCNWSFSMLKLRTHILHCRPATDARNICLVCKKIIRKKWKKHLIHHVQSFECPFPHCRKNLSYEHRYSHFEAAHIHEVEPNKYELISITKDTPRYKKATRSKSRKSKRVPYFD